MVMTGSAVVLPMRTAQGPSRSSPSSSATTAPGLGISQASSTSPAVKPMRFPKDIFITASASPFSTAQAALTLPARHKS